MPLQVIVKRFFKKTRKKLDIRPMREYTVGVLGGKGCCGTPRLRGRVPTLNLIRIMPAEGCVRKGFSRLFLLPEQAFFVVLWKKKGC